MPVETALLPIDKLIASIYSGISEPRPWQTFLYHLRERTDSELASLSLRRGRNGAVPIVILDRRYEISKEDALTMARDYAALIDQDPISSTRSTPGKVTSLRELVPPEERAQNAFYQKLMKPGGVEHYVGMWFGEPRGWRCLIRLMNRPDKPDYGESDRVLLRTLHPHLETALSLFAEIRRSRSELSEFHASLDRLLIGVMVLDSAGELVDANQAARSICSTNPLIHIRNSRMRFGSAQHNEEFNRILDSVLLSPSDHEGGPLVETLRMEAPGGQQLELLVRRVGSLFLGLFSYEAHYAVYEPGGFYARHLDAFKGARNRVVSTVFYLNENWVGEDGGELAVFSHDGAREPVALIAPELGTLAIFLSEDIPHEVRLARRERYSIAGWFRVNDRAVAPSLQAPPGALA